MIVHYLKIINIFLKIICLFWCKLSEKLKNNIKISVVQAVLELLINTYRILFWSITQDRTTWPTEILMSFLSFSDNLLQDAYMFQKSVNDFEIAHIIS